MERITSWIASLPWRVVVMGVVSFLLGYGATRLLDWGVDDKGTRDIGIVAVCILTIMGFYSALVFSPWVRGQDSSPPANPEAESETAGSLGTALALATPPAEPVANGETKVFQVSNYGGLGDSGQRIDYYPPQWIGRELVSEYQELKSFADLKLGELALIRRLAVAPDGWQPSRRCSAVLHASGIAHPESSIATLEDLLLVEANEDDVHLTERGRRLVYLSTQALAHDAGLVSAYRRVTPNINRAVRFDGRGLSR